MLSRTLFRATTSLRAGTTMKLNAMAPLTQKRVFSSDVGLADMPDVFKVNYTEEFDQGLTDE